MIPTPFSVTILHRGSETPGSANGYGEPDYEWAPEVVPVHGMAPGPAVNIVDPTREAEEVAWTIYAPAGTTLPQGRTDKVIIPVLGEFPVVGTPQDWSKGPWANPAAGVVIEVGKVEG